MSFKTPRYWALAILLLSQLCYSISVVYPTHLLIASYGRKGGDKATKDTGEIVEIFRRYCPFLPEVHYLDDLTPEQIEAIKKKYPNETFILLNAHGFSLDGVFQVGSSKSLFAPGDLVVNNLANLAENSKTWVGTCHSGMACPKIQYCVGSECAHDQWAQSGLPVLRKLIPLYCSSKGADGCVLFNQTDKNHDGTIDKEELTAFLLIKRMEKKGMVHSSIEQFQEAAKQCATLPKGKVIQHTTTLDLRLRFTQKGKDFKSEVDAYKVLGSKAPFNHKLGSDFSVPAPYKREWSIADCSVERHIGANEANTYGEDATKILFKEWPQSCDLSKLPEIITLVDGSTCKLSDLIRKSYADSTEQKNENCSLNVERTFRAECEFEEDGIATQLPESPYNHPDLKTFSLENRLCPPADLADGSSESQSPKKTH